MACLHYACITHSRNLFASGPEEAHPVVHVQQVSLAIEF
jgi:hypothetical protein